MKQKNKEKNIAYFVGMTQDDVMRHTCTVTLGSPMLSSLQSHSGQSVDTTSQRRSPYSPTTRSSSIVCTRLRRFCSKRSTESHRPLAELNTQTGNLQIPRRPHCPPTTADFATMVKRLTHARRQSSRIFSKAAMLS